MKHGHKKQVSSETVLQQLVEDKENQQKLVEKAVRVSGRGRRSRKKTCSDMSGMLFSTEQVRPRTAASNGSKVLNGISEKAESKRHSINSVELGSNHLSIEENEEQKNNGSNAHGL